MAIVLTSVAILVSGAAQTVLQYLATLGFVLAWAATCSGVYNRGEPWLRGACLKSLKCGGSSRLGVFLSWRERRIEAVIVRSLGQAGDSGRYSRS
ncbi:hypothetical protein [Amycolatopsis sp. DSM 110486]|uniref:hypothetical protein n=1 Tax=Amycolatopsis sp. DSM 110486 TaxID=2865832 RepID=UPI001C6A4AAD|nr:hypothetical protein [Amycolatopsis sp. DSM 110486]QYN20887.1 hypothetical protein K1T34_51990 [Amycolatopsis sp. DSM 110486]